MIYYGYYNKIDNEKSIFHIQINNLSTKLSIEMIIINIISKYMLKYKYFIHHYISLILFFLSSIGFDLILDNYTSYFGKLKWTEILSIVLGFILEGVYFCYIKYMIDIHYHYYSNIIFAIGIMVVVINSITVIAYIIIGNKSSLPDFVKHFWNYFDIVPKNIRISRFFFVLVLQFFYSLFEILTIFYFFCEFIILSQYLCMIVACVFTLYNEWVILGNKHDEYKPCFLIFYLIKIFSLLIYIESLELNFCNLNKNTKRNIKSRVNDDLIERKDSFNDNSFEGKGGYIFKNEVKTLAERDKIKMELKEIKIEEDNHDNI